MLPGSGLSQYRYVILSVTWVAYAVSSAARLSLGPLAPFMISDLGLSRAELGLFYSFIYLGYVFAQMPAGMSIDRFGVRPLLVFAQLVLGGASVSMLAVTSTFQGWFVEFLAGLAAGCLIASTTKAVMVWFPAGERATAMGIQTTSLNLGGIGAAMLMPIIALTYGWRFGFVVLGSVATVSSVVSLALFRDPPARAASAQKSSNTAVSPRVSLLAVLSNKNVVFAAFGAFFLAIVEFALIMNLVLFLNESLLMSVVVASVYLALVEGTGALGKAFWGLVSDRFLGTKRRLIWAFAGAITLVCTILIAFVLPRSSPLVIAIVLGVFGLAGLGWGGLYLTLLGELAGRERSGVATGFGLTVTSLGIVAGPPIFGLIVDITRSYELAWLFTAACAVLGTLLILLIKEEK